MKLATWNVNSLKVRLPQVLDWLAANPVDVLCLQEIKQQLPQGSIGLQVLFTENGESLKIHCKQPVACTGDVLTALEAVGAPAGIARLLDPGTPFLEWIYDGPHALPDALFPDMVKFFQSQKQAVR